MSRTRTREQSPACHTTGASTAQHPFHKHASKHVFYTIAVSKAQQPFQTHASKAQHVIPGASKAQHPVHQTHHYSPKPDVTHGVKAPLKSYSYSTQNIHMVGGGPKLVNFEGANVTGKNRYRGFTISLQKTSNRSAGRVLLKFGVNEGHTHINMFASPRCKGTKTT